MKVKRHPECDLQEENVARLRLMTPSERLNEALQLTSNMFSA